jgi:Glycosyltransferases, probably involved in cell wall biogenesis
MRVVKACYRIKYCFKKLFEIEDRDFFCEVSISWYYKIFKSSKCGISLANKRKRKLIVSMTSIPLRMDKIWITIESLLRQTYKPDKIILWLAEDEFRDVKLPAQLKEQQKRGLEIRYCDNLRSYKKFYYTAKEYSGDYVVTVDDDIIYAEDMLEKLIKTYTRNPGCIICNRAHCIKQNNTGLKEYGSWIKYEDIELCETKPSFYNFFTSGAGTLLPVFRFNREVLNKDAFIELAPYADDVWLNFCAWKSGIKTVKAKGILGYIVTIESSSEKGLSRINAMYKKNDEQIEKVLKYLEIDINKYLSKERWKT